MKKALSLLAAVLMCVAVNAQFSENFDAVADGGVPTGWVTYGDGLANYGSLASYNDSWQAFQGSMLCITYTTDATTPVNRWLVTPQVAVPTNNPMLSFDIFGVAYGPESQYAESLKVMVSTTGQEQESFTLLEDKGNLNAGSNTYAVDLSAYAGQSVYLAFVCYTADGMYIFLDNVDVNAVPDYGIQYAAADAPGFAAMGGEVTVTYAVRNTGFNNLTSFDMSYSVNGGAATTVNVTGIDVPYMSYSVQTFTYTQATAGVANIAISVSNPCGEADPDMTDNDGSVAVSFYNADNTATRNAALLEHFTTAQCQYCPQGHESLKQSIQGIEDKVAWVSHHVGFGTDNMTISESEEVMNEYGVAGAPYVVINRNINYSFADEGESLTVASGIGGAAYDRNRLTRAGNEPAFSTLSFGDITFDEATRQLTIPLSGTIAIDLPRNPRLTVYITEDSIIGAQVDYQRGRISDYQHDHVLRGLVNGIWGEELEVSAAGSSFDKTYTYTVPASWKIGKCRVIAFVSDNGTSATAQTVFNAGRSSYLRSGVTGIANVEPSINIVTYPNPATEMAYVTAESTIRHFDVVNTLGQTVMQGDVNCDILEMNVSGMLQGVYFVTVRTDNGSATERLVVK